LRQVIQEESTIEIIDKVHEFMNLSVEEKQIQADNIYNIYKKTLFLDAVKVAITL
jgi:predicted nucleotide-binding protein (sugar kinase/HSP70/actin superfamily)